MNRHFLKDYSPAEINRLCAERVGWTRSKICFTHDMDPLWKAPGGMEYYSPPGYCQDRNALPELWAHLTDDQWLEFQTELTLAIEPNGESLVETGLLLSRRSLVTSSPLQQAVAFLKATDHQKEKTGRDKND